MRFKQPTHLRTVRVAEILRSAWKRSQGSLSLMVVWICSGLFIGAALLDLFGIADRSTTYSFLGLSYHGTVRRLWIHQLVTAPLMHAGLMHLLMNMLVLWMFGPEVEQRLGKAGYVRFSVACAVSSMIGSLLLNWGTHRMTLGYSGVVYGLLVAAAVFHPNHTVLMFWFVPIKMKYVAIILTAIAFYMTILPEGDNVSHVSHLCGAGVAFVYLKVPGWMKRSSDPTPQKPSRRPLHRSKEDIRRAARRKLLQDVPKKL